MGFSVRLIAICVTLVVVGAMDIGSVESGEGEAVSIGGFGCRQVVEIPIDTSLAQAVFQPIDVCVTFDDPCWAINETINSVRVAIEDDSGLREIESQVYDLEFKEESIISSCSIVFLIPDGVDGSEQYVVLYDDSPVESSGYPDHVAVFDLHHYYEPISGQCVDFEYYQIEQEGCVIYGVIQEGILLGNGVSHTIVKCKEGTEVFEVFGTDQVATFYMSHHTSGMENGGIGWTGTGWADDVSSSILVDGNLMVKMRITSLSPEGTLKTDNIYTYYYCPGNIKRIGVHANHEVVEKVEVTGALERDGTYASLSTFKSRIAAIEKMNIGQIMPYLHVYGEDEMIKEFSIPPDPASSKEEWILSTMDDCDLGSRAWLCFDDPSGGRAHGIIFHSDVGLTSGEEDGLQVKAAVKQHVKLPGLEADTGDVYVTRNSYESGGVQDTLLREGFEVSFDAEFITVEEGGYLSVDSESAFYQALVLSRPSECEGVVQDDEEVERYGLTVFVHDVPSFPLGSMMSAVLGWDFSFVTVEVYEDERLVSSGSAGRLPMGSLGAFPSDVSFWEKMVSVFGAVDGKNASFFKKVCFRGVDEGTYVIKVYKENPLFFKERVFVGCEVCSVVDDAVVHVHCTEEAGVQVSSLDGDGEGVEQVQVALIKDDCVIAQGVSDSDGIVILGAPYSGRDEYVLQTRYQGFLIDEEELRLGLASVVLPLKREYGLSLHTLEVEVVDMLGLTPAVDLSPVLTSGSMVSPTRINPDDGERTVIVFSDLYDEEYVLRLSYKSFALEEEMWIDEDRSLDLVFPAVFEVRFDVFGSQGLSVGEGEVILEREGKRVCSEMRESAMVSVPPGRYDLHVLLDGEYIASQMVDIQSDKAIVVVADHGSFLHALMVYMGIIVGLFAVIYGVVRKEVVSALKLVSVAFVIIAVFSPWWVLSGEQEGEAVMTMNYVFPSKIMTFASVGSYEAGEMGIIPSEVTMVFDGIVVALVLVCIGSVSSMVVEKYSRRVSKISLVLGVVVLFVALLVYFITMSMVMGLGVGGFFGKGVIDATVPGAAEGISVMCSWGAGSGLFCGCLALIFLSVALVLQKRMEGDVLILGGEI